MHRPTGAEARRGRPSRPEHGSPVGSRSGGAGAGAGARGCC